MRSEIELVYISTLVLMFVPPSVQPHVFHNQFLHFIAFVFFCFTSLWIFYLIWVSIVKEELIDFCPRAAFSSSPSGFAAGCDNT